MNLPARPSLDHLKHQARDLQKTEGLKLASAQRELAKRYGFRDWAALRAHVLGGRLEATVADALGGRRAPDLAKAHPIHALLQGETVDLDPNAPLEPRGWPPLGYLLFSRIADPDARLASAEDLLQRGADANWSWIHPEYPDPPQTCLAAAVAIQRDAELTALLVAHGANPSDGEGMYHGTEEDGHACLRLLLEAGGRPEGFNTIAHMLDRHDVAGLRLVLSHWAKPDEELSAALHCALVRGRDAVHLSELLEAGADPEFRLEGVTAHARARLLGRADLAAVIPGPPLTAAERFLAACVDREPAEAVPIPAELGWVLSMAAGRDQVAAVERMLDAGMDVESRGDGDRTALSQAAWNGADRSTALLLSRGADLTPIDQFHCAPPLNWSVAGGAWRINPRGDYPEVIRMLVKAGALGHREFIADLVKDRSDLKAALEGFDLEPPTEEPPEKEPSEKAVS